MTGRTRKFYIEIEKTGALVFLREYHMFARGDAFRINTGRGAGVYIFRLNTESYFRELSEASGFHVHYEVEHLTTWWDEHKSRSTSTLVAVSPDVKYFGHGGEVRKPQSTET